MPQRAVVRKEENGQFPAQHDEGFRARRIEMGVRTDVGALLQGIEEALTPLGESMADVVI